MGHLTYGAATDYEIDDRMLAHLKVVVASKLRRQESFLVSWIIDAQHGSGRISLWMAPTIPLQFRFSGSRAPKLNQAWLEVLMDMANTPRGVVLVSEAEAEALHRDHRSAGRD